MRIKAADNLSLIEDQLEADTQIEAAIYRATEPIFEDRDRELADILAERPPLLRERILIKLREYERPLKEALFGIAPESERLLRAPLAKRGVQFESDAVQFFESSAAESVNRLSEWLSAELTADITEPRFIELRAKASKGFFRETGRRYIRRRTSGETRRKLADAKAAAVAYNVNKQLSAALTDELRAAASKGREFIEGPDAERLIENQKDTDLISFAILGKRPAQIAIQKKRVVIKTEQPDELYDLYLEDVL